MLSNGAPLCQTRNLRGLLGQQPIRVKVTYPRWHRRHHDWGVGISSSCFDGMGSDHPHIDALHRAQQLMGELDQIMSSNVAIMLSYLIELDI